jgi:hypothetical protein
MWKNISTSCFSIGKLQRLGWCKEKSQGRSSKVAMLSIKRLIKESLKSIPFVIYIVLEA